MKNLYIILGLLIVLSSCDDRALFLEELNNVPTLSFKNSTELMFKDSVKISLKGGKEASEFVLNALDKDNNIKSITFEVKTGAGELIQNNTIQTSDLDIVEEMNLTFKPSKLGINTLVFTITDSFDKTSSVTAEITAFDNLTPIANFSVNPIKSTGLYEYEIDASSSYDQDKNFGGTIVLYEYDVNGLIFQSTSNKLKFDFGKPGTYTIKLKVKDSNGIWSSTEKTITI